MFVKYEDKRVKELFDDLNDIQNSKNLMRKQVGLEITKAIKRKYNQLVAFTNFSALIQSRIGKVEHMEGSTKEYSLHLTTNYRLIIVPETDDLSVEGLKVCDTFIVKGVLDYHGKGAKNNWIMP